jgi:hypothetical protein
MQRGHLPSWLKRRMIRFVAISSSASARMRCLASSSLSSLRASASAREGTHVRSQPQRLGVKASLGPCILDFPTPTMLKIKSVLKSGPPHDPLRLKRLPHRSNRFKLMNLDDCILEAEVIKSSWTYRCMADREQEAAAHYFGFWKMFALAVTRRISELNSLELSMCAWAAAQSLPQASAGQAVAVAVIPPPIVSPDTKQLCKVQRPSVPRALRRAFASAGIDRGVGLGRWITRR